MIDDEPYWNEIKNCPYFCVSQTLVNGLRKHYKGKFEAYQRTYVFSPHDSSMLYLLFNAVKDNMRQLFQGASGSTIKFLTKGMLENITILIPSESILAQFNTCSEAYQRKIEVLKGQIVDALEARDRLLPKLMSGEIEL